MDIKSGVNKSSPANLDTESLFISKKENVL